MQAFIAFCIANPIIPATISIIVMGMALSVAAVLEYPDPYRPRRRALRPRRYSRR